jgi:hypothetical protein
MVYREMTKLQKRQTLTRKEKDTLRRKKLKEVRKGQGGGRPFQPAFHNTRKQLNALRDKEMERVRNNMNMSGGDYEVAKRYAIFQRPETTKGN